MNREDTIMTSSQIDRLIKTAAPLWAGEAEVVRTYWTSPVRNAETDMRWLERQCFKEFWGSGTSKYDRGGVFVGVLKHLLGRYKEIDVSFDRREVLDVLEGVKAEFSHYCAFADAYDAIRPAGTPRINPERLESWPEEDALTALRVSHQEQHGAVGLRACSFGEGGYCTLFREGRKLRGRGGFDEQIAAACEMVYEDEIDHMLHGIAGIADSGFGDAEYELMRNLLTQQLQLRIRMRNAQFSFPLAEERVQAIFRGEIAPEPFDYARAGIAA
jgi:hypothetical protein